MSTGPQEHNRNRDRNNRGPNRNRNRNNNRNRDNRSNDGNQSSRPQSQHQSFVSRTPVTLTFWQKLLKMVGLYKEPVKPSRPGNSSKTQSNNPRSENTRTEKSSGDRPPRTNTRGTRTPSEPRPPREPRERREPSLADVESTRLYIGNLSYDATEFDIEELFKGIGPVRSVEVVYNKHTHKSKGYGFVEMLRIDEAKRSVEVLHDQHFMGRQLIVSGAKAKNADGEEPEERAERPARAERAPREEAAPVAVNEVAATEVAELSEVTPETAIVEEVHSLEASTEKETFA